LRRLVSTLRINSCVLRVSSKCLFLIARNSIYQETSQVNIFTTTIGCGLGCYETALSVPTGSIRAHGTLGV